MKCLYLKSVAVVLITSEIIHVETVEQALRVQGGARN